MRKQGKDTVQTSIYRGDTLFVTCCYDDIYSITVIPNEKRPSTPLSDEDTLRSLCALRAVKVSKKSQQQQQQQSKINKTYDVDGPFLETRSTKHKNATVAGVARQLHDAEAAVLARANEEGITGAQIFPWSGRITPQGDALYEGSFHIWVTLPHDRNVDMTLREYKLMQLQHAYLGHLLQTVEPLLMSLFSGDPRALGDDKNTHNRASMRADTSNFAGYGTTAVKYIARGPDVDSITGFQVMWFENESDMLARRGARMQRDDMSKLFVWIDGKKVPFTACIGSHMRNGYYYPNYSWNIPLHKSPEAGTGADHSVTALMHPRSNDEGPPAFSNTNKEAWEAIQHYRDKSGIMGTQAEDNGGSFTSATDSADAPMKRGQSMLSKRRYRQIEEKFKEILIGDSKEENDGVLLSRLLTEFREIMQFDPEEFDMSSLDVLLAAAHVKNFPAPTEATHGAMGDPMFGSFAIPDGGPQAQAFREAYVHALRDEGRPMSIVEAHTDTSHVIVDLDMRQTTPERIYTQKHIENFMDALVAATKYFVDQQHMDVVILEKPNPRLDKKHLGVYKDGLHVFMPNVITHPEIQLAIREHFVNDVTEHMAFASTICIPGLAEMDPGKIYGESVIKRGGRWFLYGSNRLGRRTQLMRIDVVVIVVLVLVDVAVILLITLASGILWL
eukprot:gene29750-biopygen5520